MHRLRDTVPSRIRNKGRTYFQRRTVQLSPGGQDRISANVQGSRLYPVEIHLDREKLVARCGCPYFGSGEICKHIWATLLEAESAGRFQRVASAWDPYLVHGDQRDGGIHATQVENEDTDYDFTY